MIAIIKINVNVLGRINLYCYFLWTFSILHQLLQSCINWFHKSYEMHAHTKLLLAVKCVACSQAIPTSSLIACSVLIISNPGPEVGKWPESEATKWVT